MLQIASGGIAARMCLNTLAPWSNRAMSASPPSTHASQVAKKTAMRAIGRTEEDTASTTTAASQAKFGWMDYPAGPPQTQLMSRDSSSSVNAMLHGDDGKPDWAALGETLHGELEPLKRSWSVAY